MFKSSERPSWYHSSNIVEKQRCMLYEATRSARNIITNAGVLTKGVIHCAMHYQK